MKKNLAKDFHLYAKRLLNTLDVPLDRRQWPSSWLEAEYKEYPRLQRVALPKPLPPDTSLTDTLINRKSTQEYQHTLPISAQELSTLLYYGAGLRQEETPLKHARRFYPSGGRRYPLEVYLIIKEAADIPEGIYHYHLPSHSLEAIAGKREARKFAAEAISYGPAREASVYMLITSVWERNFRKYKDFGYPLVLLDAGHLAQNIVLLTTALNLKSCPAACFRIDEVCSLLDIDSPDEAPVHMILLGK